jgi:hypothetical protein
MTKRGRAKRGLPGTRECGMITVGRGVAQLGRALGSGLRGPRFKSAHPDSSCTVEEPSCEQQGGSCCCAYPWDCSWHSRAPCSSIAGHAPRHTVKPGQPRETQIRDRLQECLHDKLPGSVRGTARVVDSALGQSATDGQTGELQGAGPGIIQSYVGIPSFRGGSIAEKRRSRVRRSTVGLSLTGSRRSVSGS